MALHNFDGRYIDSQRNPSKKWAGSDNQRVIDVEQSLAQNKIVLYCDQGANSLNVLDGKEQ